MPHIYDPEPLTDDSTLTIADLKFIVILSTPDPVEADRVADRLDRAIELERRRLGLVTDRHLNHG